MDFLDKMIGQRGIHQLVDAKTRARTASLLLHRVHYRSVVHELIPGSDTVTMKCSECEWQRVATGHELAALVAKR